MKQDKEKLWSQRIQEQKMSTLSQKQWCQENNVNFHTFNYWIKKIRANNLTPMAKEKTTWIALEKMPLIQTKSFLRISIQQAVIEINQPTEEIICSVIRTLMQHDS